MIEVLKEAIDKQFDTENLLASFYLNLDYHVVKKNNRPIHKHRRTGIRSIGKSQRLINAEEAMTLEFQQQAIVQNLRETLNQPMWAVFHFYFTKETFFTKKGKISKNLPDLTNLIELPQDCLTNAGIIEDDSLIHSVDMSRRLVGPRCRLEVYIFTLDIKDLNYVNTVV